MQLLVDLGGPWTLNPGGLVEDTDGLKCVT
jgi:hypothetical protein